jgi:hypothetical protein
MFRKTLAAGIIAAISAIALVVALATFSRGDPTAATNEDAAFEGKIVYVVAKNDPTDGPCLEKVSVRRLLVATLSGGFLLPMKFDHSAAVLT